MITMAKSLSCADTEEDLMAEATEHVKESHKELQMTPELTEKIKSLIKDV